MKILKPDNLALLYRCFTFAGRNTLSIGMMGFFHFERGGREQLLPEAQLWADVAKVMADSGIEAPLDEGWPKPSAEFMLYGAAYAPQGGATGHLTVSAKVGGVAKQLYVFGDRQFGAAGLPSQPLPFTRMPLSPAAAFGGVGFADNPAGKGFAEAKSADGLLRRALPNIEHPRHMMTAAGDCPPPAGFGALAPDHSARRQHLGRFDERWLKQAWPNLPDETRLDYFFSAPPDQRLPGYLRGDEGFEAEHMHPARPRLAGRLPGLRARCFVHRKLADGAMQFSEIETRAETVWLLPELECGIVLYRASAKTDDSDADDVLHAMAEWENMGDAPLPFEHYEQLFRKQIEFTQDAVPVAAPALAAGSVEAAGAPAAIPAAAVVPAAAVSAVAVVDPALQNLEKLAQDMQAQTSELLRRHGLTEADIVRPPTEPPETTLAELETMTAEIEAKTNALLKEHGMTEADIARPPTEPPETSLAQLQAETAKMEAQTHALLQKHGLTEADIQAYLASQPGKEQAAQFMRESPIALAQQQSELDALIAQAALLPAMPAAALALPKLPEMPDISDMPPAKLTREDVVDRHSRQESMAGLDLSGLDLSALNLAGADFSGALLDGTGFQQSVLAGARFNGALLQASDFSEADLTGAGLTGVAGAGAVFAKAKLDSSDLTESDFSGGDFSEAALNRATLTYATFNGASMAGLKAAGCQAANASFNDCKLDKADFSGARLPAAQFNGAQCVSANMAGSICDQAEFYGSNLNGACFDTASLRASRAGSGTVFDGAAFVAAQMGKASWEGASMAGADFSRAVLDDADFSKTLAQGARFGQVSAQGAKFSKADLSKADLTGVNLFKGSLRKSKLDDAVLHFANLYGVDFESTKTKVAMLEGANIDQTILGFRPPLA